MAAAASMRISMLIIFYSLWSATLCDSHIGLFCQMSAHQCNKWKTAYNPESETDERYPSIHC